MVVRSKDAGALQLVTHTDPPGGEYDAEDARLVMEAMRRLAEEQAERAERMRSTGRQLLVIVAAIFTVAQTVATNSVGKDGVTGTETDIILCFAIAAAFSFFVLGYTTLQADRLTRVKDIAPRDILDQADKAVDDGEFISDRLTKLYLDVAKRRAAVVDTRREWLVGVHRAAVVCTVAIVAELLATLISLA